MKVAPNMLRLLFCACYIVYCRGGSFSSLSHRLQCLPTVGPVITSEPGEPRKTNEKHSFLSSTSMLITCMAKPGSFVFVGLKAVTLPPYPPYLRTGCVYSFLAWISLSFSLSLSLSLLVCLSVCLSLSLSEPPPPHPDLSLSLSEPPPPPPTPMSLSLSVSLSVCFSVSLSRSDMTILASKTKPTLPPFPFSPRPPPLSLSLSLCAERHGESPRQYYSVVLFMCVLKILFLHVVFLLVSPRSPLSTPFTHQGSATYRNRRF